MHLFPQSSPDSRSRLWRLPFALALGYVLSGIGSLGNCGLHSACESSCCHQTSEILGGTPDPCCAKPVPRTHCEAASCCLAAEPETALPANPAESQPALQPLWTLVQGPPVPALNPEDPHRFAGFDEVRPDTRPIYARLNMLRC
ncbi:MAG: hypothetical protein ACO3N7_09255 [Kiritimatiellia bacterium]